MQIHELSITTQKKKRIGRGGKRGTYSGRGMKGQKARSGGNVDPLFEGGRTTLVDKMKKNRGFKSPHPKKTVVTLERLEKCCKDGDRVDIALLYKYNILSKKNIKNGARIVANGAINKKITVTTEVGISQTAKETIEKSGGSVELNKETKK